MSVSQNFPNIDPSLRLNFQGARTLDPRITFERSSIGTYVDEDGLIKTAAADQARFDYDPATGESLGLLIEQSRTNLVTSSSNAAEYFTLQNSTITSNTIAAPDGTITADLIVPNTTIITHASFNNTQSISSNTTYTFSIFAKPNNYTWLQLVFTQPFGNINAWVNYNLTGSGSFGFTGGGEISKSIKSYPNGWYLCTITATSGVGASVGGPAYIVLDSDRNSRDANYAGDDTSGLYIWGAQVEAGSFPTSYIPTSGSTVTRSADTAQITGTNFSSWYNQSEGTIFANFSAKGAATAGYPGVYWFNNNLTGSRGYALVKETGPQTRVFQRGDDAVLYRVMFGANISDGTFSKVCTFYTNSQIGGSQNNEFVSPTSITSPYSVNRLYIGYHSSGGGTSPLYLNSHLKQLIYYPVRISDIKLQQMTKVFS